MLMGNEAVKLIMKFDPVDENGNQNVEENEADDNEIDIGTRNEN
jgi:hypothetical protein